MVPAAGVGPRGDGRRAVGGPAGTPAAGCVVGGRAGRVAGSGGNGDTSERQQPRFRRDRRHIAHRGVRRTSDEHQRATRARAQASGAAEGPPAAGTSRRMGTGNHPGAHATNPRSRRGGTGSGHQQTRSHRHRRRQSRRRLRSKPPRALAAAGGGRRREGRRSASKLYRRGGGHRQPRGRARRRPPCAAVQAASNPHPRPSQEGPVGRAPPVPRHRAASSCRGSFRGAKLVRRSGLFPASSRAPTLTAPSHAG